MDIDTLRSFLGWCSVINIGLLLWWWGWFVFGHEFIFKMHTRWFRLTQERFDAIHYGAIAGFKLGIMLLNVVPWIALTVMAK